jgi:hypothetical protein
MKNLNGKIHTLVYFILSTSVLSIGIIPRRCAMNSSAKTVVFVSISTMSMATNGERCQGTFRNVDTIVKLDLPIVGTSAIITRLSELATLIKKGIAFNRRLGSVLLVD